MKKSQLTFSFPKLEAVSLFHIKQKMVLKPSIT
nr:MAG TPA: hypothetical protein [Caudoviricetes sp.]